MAKRIGNRELKQLVEAALACQRTMMERLGAKKGNPSVASCYYRAAGSVAALAAVQDALSSKCRFPLRSLSGL